MATRKSRPPPVTHAPPEWRWVPGPGEGARVGVFKDKVQWSIWDEAPRGDGAAYEQTVADFLQRGPGCGWAVPEEVRTALRTWCEQGVWRSVTWLDHVSVIWHPSDQGPGSTMVTGDLQVQSHDGDTVADQVRAALALGFSVVSDVSSPRARTVSLTRPWVPQAP